MNKRAVFYICTPEIDLFVTRIEPDPSMRFNLTIPLANPLIFSERSPIEGLSFTLWSSQRTPASQPAQSPHSQSRGLKKKQEVLAIFSQPYYHALLHQGGNFYYRRHGFADIPIRLTPKDIAALLMQLQHNCNGRITTRGKQFIQQWQTQDV